MVSSVLYPSLLIAQVVSLPRVWYHSIAVSLSKQSSNDFLSAKDESNQGFLFKEVWIQWEFGLEQNLARWFSSGLFFFNPKLNIFICLISQKMLQNFGLELT